MVHFDIQIELELALSCWSTTVLHYLLMFLNSSIYVLCIYVLATQVSKTMIFFSTYSHLSNVTMLFACFVIVVYFLCFQCLLILLVTYHVTMIFFKKICREMFFNNPQLHLNRINIVFSNDIILVTYVNFLFRGTLVDHFSCYE